MKSLVPYLFVVGLAVTMTICPVENVSAQAVPFSVQKAKYGTETQNSVNVPYTEMVTQTYTVNIPYTENVMQPYTVEVPYTENVKDDDGEMKTVTKTRTETRTRKVPVTKIRAEEKTRQVPVTRMRSEVRTSKFPPANAKFSYASGGEISDQQLKTIAAHEIPILRLSPGQKLTELQRSVLKPDTVVMTLPADVAKDAPNMIGD